MTATPATNPTPASTPLRLRRVFATWWPLAASWGLMGIELPIVSAVMARLAHPEVHLAAYGGFVFPIALIIESPVIMLLAASTALGRDAQRYRLMHRVMMVLGGVFTALHAILAFTPAFDVILVALLDPPASVIEPARLGLQIMLPWTWTIAYRRFHQGILIRFGQSGAVGIGTAIRLATGSTIALAGLALGLTVAPDLPGILVATIAIAAGVTSEAIYSGLRARPVVRGPLRDAAPIDPPLTLAGFRAFYVPLALTSLLLLLVQPIGAAAIGRMPLALASLATWPVVNGIVFLLRSAGFAYNEVVVALADEPHATATLQRFTLILALATTSLGVLVAFTPLSTLWFETLSGLPPELATLAKNAFWIGIVWAPLDVMRNALQGRMVHAGRTRPISASVALFLVVASGLLAIGVALQRGEGLVVAMIAFVVAQLTQLAFLAWHVRRLPHHEA